MEHKVPRSFQAFARNCWEAAGAGGGWRRRVDGLLHAPTKK